MKVAVIGLGKLGLPMAIAIAKQGVQVFGVEKDFKRLRLIRQGRSPVDEPGVQINLKNLLREKRFICSDYAEAVSEAEAAFIAVNTPEKSPGEMDTRDLETCVAELGRELRDQSKFYVVAVVSTLLPETTDRKLRPILERASGKKVGESIGLCANPVFIALTTVIHDFLNPPLVLVGTSDPLTLKWMVNFYLRVCKNHSPILRTNPLTAEIIKLTHNAYCTSKMTFVNEVADLCSRLPGGDIRKVEKFFSMGGERTGRFLKAGFGFGGPCFPRDLRFFLKYVEKKGLKPPLLNAISESNEAHARDLVRQIRRQVGPLKGKRISVLGLSYKPGVKNFEDSFSLRLIQELARKKARIFAYEPFLKSRPFRNDSPRPPEDAKFVLRKSLLEVLKDADVCILAHPSSEFQNLKKKDLRGMKYPHVFDPWGVLSG